MAKNKATVNEKSCVACGTCTKVCFANAIKMHKGVHAIIDVKSCIGCGKCEKECPASILKMEAV